MGAQLMGAGLTGAGLMGAGPDGGPVLPALAGRWWSLRGRELRVRCRKMLNVTSWLYLGSAGRPTG